MKKYLSFAVGAFGHDAFYNTLSLYFVMFVTSQLFVTNDQNFNSTMIGYVTLLMTVIRVGEIMFDPMIGGAVDNTQTRWGKFKPWLLIGTIVASLMLVLIFTDFGGLATNKPMLYLVLFGIAFLLLDVFYSFSDIALWSMLPALSLDSEERTKFGTFSRFGSTLGAQSVIIIIVPVVTFFSGIFGASAGEQNKWGWLGYAMVIALLASGGAIFLSRNVKEDENVIRENVEHTRFRDVFKVIGSNDQLMWLALSYFLFAFSYVINNSLLLYYFRYVLGHAEAYTIVGVITCFLGVLSVSIFPALAAKIGRKYVYIGGIGIMLMGFIVFAVAGQSVPMALVASSIIFFPYPLVFLATLMTISDLVEYGQLKSGKRNEAVTLSVRPLIDKLAGAFSNGIVGIVAVGAGMTGNALPSDITQSGLLQFKAFMFYGPMALLVVSALIFLWKVTLTENKHAEIVEELEERLTAEDA
ncbi:glycoside-pentoside-hexuronide (GPH):cation symporter [Weissella minor]|uniref:GalP protein n=1 Tax=Weissella minor TaxID=1620 RepID=A0A0R2JKW8_9LACO|nr:glycoside-pentoside-hexuronide (GPH):cation symporter [Weissella minor]KRN77825.1 galP protein [Weissella minor]